MNRSIFADDCVSGCAEPSSRRKLLAGWFVALGVAGVLYAFTMAPDLVWQDAGDYQWQAAKLNLVRPGDTIRVHPFFLVLAHGLGRLGVWNYAKAASVASIAGTAILAANIWLLSFLLTRRLVPSIIAFLACLLAHTIWQQGVQPQTYGWSNAFSIAVLIAAVGYIRTGRLRWLMLMFFLGGMGLSVHMMSQLALGVLGVWVLLRVIRRRTPAWTLAAGAALWIIGGLLFWYVVFLEYQRTGNAGATLVSAFVGKWGSAVFNISGLPGMFVRSMAMFVLNFPTPIALFGVYGIYRGIRGRQLSCGSPISGLLGAILGIYVLFAMRYRVPNQNFFFTPAYAFFSVYIALGISAARWTRRTWARITIIILAVAVVPGYWAICRLVQTWKIDLRGDGKTRSVPYRDFNSYYLLPWQCGQTGPRRFAEETLDSLPLRAVLIADSTTLPPLRYVRYFEGRRPDVLLVVPEEHREYWTARQDLLGKLQEEGRRVFVVSDHPAYIPRWVRLYGRLERFGLVYEVVEH